MWSAGDVPVSPTHYNTVLQSSGFQQRVLLLLTAKESKCDMTPSSVCFPPSRCLSCSCLSVLCLFPCRQIISLYFLVRAFFCYLFCKWLREWGWRCMREWLRDARHSHQHRHMQTHRQMPTLVYLFSDFLSAWHLSTAPSDRQSLLSNPSVLP